MVDRLNPYQSPESGSAQVRSSATGRPRLMQRAVTLGILFLASYAVAFPLTPSDPFSLHLGAGAILCVAVPSYLVGLRQGRRQGVRDSKETPDASNRE